MNEAGIRIAPEHIQEKGKTSVADQATLDWASFRGIECGGWCRKDAGRQGLTASSYRRHDDTPDGVAFEQMRQFGKATDCLNESDYQEHCQDE